MCPSVSHERERSPGASKRTMSKGTQGFCLPLGLKISVATICKNVCFFFSFYFKSFIHSFIYSLIYYVLTEVSPPSSPPSSSLYSPSPPDPLLLMCISFCLVLCIRNYNQGSMHMFTLCPTHSPSPMLLHDHAPYFRKKMRHAGQDYDVRFKCLWH